MDLRRKRIRRTAGAAFVFAMLCSFVLTAFAETEPQGQNAEEITQGIEISCETLPQLSWALTDRSRSTKSALPSGQTVRIKSPVPISSVYITWDRTPDAWNITAGENELSFDKTDSFLHHYVQLEEEACEIELSAQDENGILCDMYFFTQGEPPEWVQRWHKPYERADLLVLPTHADDELLFFGGAMPYYAAERGYRVQVAYLTNHNGEPYRPHELLNGLWTCGITAYPIISEFPDYYSASLEHAMSIYNVDDVLAYQTQLIRRFKPYVVVGHDVGGEYGHGVHRLNAYGLMQIADKTNDPAWCPESAEQYGVWEIPKLYLHLYPENRITMNWNVPVRALGGKTAYEIACDAYACHVSQQSGFQMGGKGVYDCTQFGLVHTTVGADEAKDDFFEHIVFENENPQQEAAQSTSEESAAQSAYEENTAQSIPEESKAPVQENPDGTGGLKTVAFAAVCCVVLALAAAWIIRKKRR